MLRLIVTTALCSLWVLDGVASYNVSGFEEKPSLGGAMLPSWDQARKRGAMVNEMENNYRQMGGKYAPNDKNPNIQQDAELGRYKQAFSNEQNLMNPYKQFAPYTQHIQRQSFPPKIPFYQQQVPLYGDTQDKPASFQHIPKQEGGPIWQGNPQNSAHYRPIQGSEYTAQPGKIQNNMKSGQPIWNPVNKSPPLYIPKSGKPWPQMVGTGTSGDMTQVNGKRVPGTYNPSQNLPNHAGNISPQKPLQQVKTFPDDHRQHGKFVSPHGLFSTTKKPPFWRKGISVVNDFFRKVKNRATQSSNTPKPPLWRRGVSAIKDFFKKAKDIAKGALGLSVKEQRKQNTNGDQTAQRAKCNHHGCRIQRSQLHEPTSQTPKPKVKYGILSRLNSAVKRLLFF